MLYDTKSESECEKILSRVQINGNPQGYFQVNGTPYVVGESVEWHDLVTHRPGSADRRAPEWEVENY